MTTAEDWIATAPDGFHELADRLTWHTEVRWDVPDYVDDKAYVDDGRHVTTDLDEVEAFSSRWTDQPPHAADDPGSEVHGILIDLDVPAWLIPSSTSGHGHLYVDLPVLVGDLWDFLDAAVRVGLVEEGYVNACKARGMTSLRAPWVTKGEEPSTLRRRAQAEDEARRLHDQGGAAVLEF